MSEIQRNATHQLLHLRYYRLLRPLFDEEIRAAADPLDLSDDLATSVPQLQRDANALVHDAGPKLFAQLVLVDNGYLGKRIGPSDSRCFAGPS